MSENCIVSVELEDESEPGFHSFSAKPTKTVHITYSLGDKHSYDCYKQFARYLVKHRDEIVGLTKQSFYDYYKELDLRFAWNRLIASLERRDYAVGEIKAKLRKDGFRSDSIEKCIDKAKEMKLLSDDRFVDSFVRQRMASGYSVVRIKDELRMKGVDVDNYQELFENYFIKDDEITRAYALLERKVVPNKNPYQKLVSFLVRKGFAYDVSKEAVMKYLGDLN